MHQKIVLKVNFFRPGVVICINPMKVWLSSWWRNKCRVDFY